jgi:hypothetical protein
MCQSTRAFSKEGYYARSIQRFVYAATGSAISVISHGYSVLVQSKYEWRENQKITVQRETYSTAISSLYGKLLVFSPFVLTPYW